MKSTELKFRIISNKWSNYGLVLVRIFLGLFKFGFTYQELPQESFLCGSVCQRH